LLDKVDHLMPHRVVGGPANEWEGTPWEGNQPLPRDIIDRALAEARQRRTGPYANPNAGQRAGGPQGQGLMGTPRLYHNMLYDQSRANYWRSPTAIDAINEAAAPLNVPATPLVGLDEVPDTFSTAYNRAPRGRPFDANFEMEDAREIPRMGVRGQEPATARWRPGENPLIGSRGISDRYSGPSVAQPFFTGTRIGDQPLRVDGDIKIEASRGVSVGEAEPQYGGEAGFVGPGGVNSAAGQRFAGGTPSRSGRRGELPRDIEEQFATQREQFSFAAQMEAARTPRGLAAVLGTSVFGRTSRIARIQEQRRAADNVRDAMRGVFGDLSEDKARSKIERLTDLQDELGFARGKEAEGLQRQIAETVGGRESLEKLVKAQGEMQEVQKKSLPGWGSGIKNLAGATFGVFALGKATQALGFVTSAATPAVETLIDSFRGWEATSTRVTSQMGKQTLQARGNVEAIIAQQSVSAGLSSAMADYIEAALGMTVTVKAGALAQKEAEELQKAAAGVTEQQGLRFGYGGLGGGPVFAQAMGGAPGVMESIVGQLSLGRAEEPDWITSIGQSIEGLIGVGRVGAQWVGSQPFRGAVGRMAEATGQPSVEERVGGGIVNMLGAPMNAPGAVADWVATQAGLPDLFSGSLATDIITKDIPGLLGGVLGQPVAAATGEEAGPFDPYAGRTSREIANTNRQLEEFTDVIARGAGELDAEVAGGFGLARSQQELDRAIVEAAQDMDTQRFTLAEMGIVMRDSTGDLVSGIAEADEILTQFARGRTVNDPEVWARQNRRALEAQRQTNTAQYAFGERQVAFGISQNLATSPLIRPGASLFSANTPAAIRAVGGGSQTGAISGILADAQESRDDLVQIAKDGWMDMLGIVEENFPEMVGEFKTLKSEANESTRTIARLSRGMARIQQEAGEVQWANQIRLGKRALADAIGLLGEAGGSRLGYLQREQWLASRASQSLGLASQRIGLISQELSLALQRRQIATQVAVAQFQAPGETGEERYVRQREAIIRAGIQRRQVGLQGQQLGISQEQYGLATRQFRIAGQVWAENARRGAIDAGRSLEVMRVTRRAQLRAAASQEAIAIEQKALGVTMRRVNNITGAAGRNFNTALSTASSNVSNFSGALEDGEDAIRAVMGLPARQRGRGGAPDDITAGTGGQGRQTNASRSAAGFIGTTSAESTMIVGEAGAETVAVLRNPRRASMSGGGGGPVTMTININNPSVRSDSDIDRLGQSVASAVERAMAKKGEMLGLRSPSY
jgi:hypothetical protein